MKLYKHTFTVDGGVAFPLDMLRFDRCTPATETDARAIQNNIEFREPRDQRGPITLQAVNSKRDWKPTEGRWRSFMWRITSDVRTEVTAL